MANYYDETFENDVEYYENYVAIVTDYVTGVEVRAYPVDENRLINPNHHSCKRTVKQGIGGYCEHCSCNDNCMELL